MSEPHMVPLPEDEIRFNGGVRCDMAKGPCACGAWHDHDEAAQVSSATTKEGT